MQFSDKQAALPAAQPGVVQTAQGKAIILRNLSIIEGSAGAAQAAEAQAAIAAGKDAIAGLGGLDAQPGIGGLDGLGVTGTQARGRDQYSLPGTDIPTGRDLVTQDGDSPDTAHSHDGSGDSRSTRGSVWTERTTERSSGDGMRTWGSASYRDWSGNFWRSDYVIERDNDGGTTSKDTVFDSHNEPIKTTVIYTAPDGSEKVTTTDHQTGQTTTTQGQVKPEADPEPGDGKDSKDGKDKNQSETTGYRSGAFHPPVLHSPNKVNPGPDGGDSSGSAPVTPVLLDPKILVTDPAPDQPQASAAARPRDIRGGNININTIDPPRPL